MCAINFCVLFHGFKEPWSGGKIIKPFFANDQVNYFHFNLLPVTWLPATIHIQVKVSAHYFTYTRQSLCPYRDSSTPALSIPYSAEGSKSSCLNTPEYSKNKKIQVVPAELECSGGYRSAPEGSNSKGQTALWIFRGSQTTWLEVQEKTPAAP